MLYCVCGQTLSETATGGSITLFGGFTPILFTVAYVRRIVRSCLAPKSSQLIVYVTSGSDIEHVVVLGDVRAAFVVVQTVGRP